MRASGALAAGARGARGVNLPVIGFDPGPLARLEHVVVQENTPWIVFQRLCDGETLRDIARAWEIPVGRFVEWYTANHMTLFDTALRVRADQLAHEALACADAATPDDVAPRKLQVDTRLKLAAQWDRARYGAKDSGVAGGGVTVIVNRAAGSDSVPVTVHENALTVEI